MVALLCDGNVLIEDVLVIGKTMLARAISLSLGGKFKRFGCTPELFANDVTGVSIYNPIPPADDRRHLLRILET